MEETQYLFILNRFGLYSVFIVTPLIKYLLYFLVFIDIAVICINKFNMFFLIDNVRCTQYYFKSYVFKN